MKISAGRWPDRFGIAASRGTSTVRVGFGSTRLRRLAKAKASQEVGQQDLFESG